jgi:hypothetical protein
MARSIPAGLSRQPTSPLIQPFEIKTITPYGAHDGKRINKNLTRAAHFYAAFYLTEPFGSPYESEIFSLLRQVS